MKDITQPYDVLVIGGGNAALCSAITAREAGARVLLLEHASKPFRGGNSRHTRNLRCAHDGPTSFLKGAYPKETYLKELLKVTDGQTDEKLARIMIDESVDAPQWMYKRGVRFQHIQGTLGLAHSNPFFLGGGRALVNAFFNTAEALGVDVVYDSEVLEMDIRDGKFHSATVRSRAFTMEVKAKSVIVASGGFQADLAWLKEAWGEAADNFIIRGTPYNKGRLLKDLIEKGAKTIGDPQQCHAVAIDGRSPQFDAGIVTRLDCLSFGIVVNKNAERFYDEGEDFWPKRYAIWGRLVAGQPDQIAYSIIDSKSINLFMPSLFRPVQADSIRDLAQQLRLDPEKLDQTVTNFNQAVQVGTFDKDKLDDCFTTGLTPAKTHWARRIDSPPYYAYPLRPGITFTYLAVKIDEKARVIMQDDKPAENIYATGEVMAGNILGKGYMAGTGMTIGTVFGRIAGQEAAAYVA
ncbi:FAD-dependent tricarballylate dehydrogenase TcuA [Pelobacter seleniigenes]|uniref:FAD-dependent tricarballylate dehydrogenase TcuA n=1 Tax=Pelobacter seleniigenes TaxID=407188 RepID=UPI0004A6FAE0|nr:FAD-dependent tricarballylate dehydrogenase TcuA [Pelobacter seleniigenes]